MPRQWAPLSSTLPPTKTMLVNSVPPPGPAKPAGRTAEYRNVFRSGEASIPLKVRAKTGDFPHFEPIVPQACLDTVCSVLRALHRTMRTFMWMMTRSTGVSVCPEKFARRYGTRVAKELMEQHALSVQGVLSRGAVDVLHTWLVQMTAPRKCRSGVVRNQFEWCGFSITREEARVCCHAAVLAPSHAAVRPLVVNDFAQPVDLRVYEDESCTARR